MSIAWQLPDEACIGAVSARFAIAPELAPQLMLAFPELLLARQRPLAAHERAVVPWHLNDGPSLACRAVFVFHSLSPLGDTALLFASLGSSIRVAALLNLPLELALTDVDIARHNRMVRALGGANLERNRAGRMWLYQWIGARVRLAALTNLPGGVSAQRLADEASEIDGLWRELSHELDLADLPQRDSVARLRLQETLAMHERRATPQRAGALRVVRALLRAFGRIDWETLFYFLAQRYHQHAYSECLKIGILSERRFDEPALLLDLLEHGAPRGISRALYVTDYLVGHSYRTRVGIHPYCFPSGTAWDRLRDVEACQNLTIHLDDLDDSGQIRRALALSPYPHNARFVADLLSFLHRVRGALDAKHDAAITEALARVSPEWGSAWRTYAIDDEAFADQAQAWLRACVARAGCAGIPPYHLYPYFLLTNGSTGEALTDVVITALSVLREALHGSPLTAQRPA